MKKFIGKHRKIISLMGVLLAAVIISVVTFGGIVNDVIAGVFKGDTDMDKIEKNEKNKIVILEIVPQYGQQVIGYTVPGYEPITKEAIEAYPVDNGGRLDPTTSEFTNATGWIVKEASGNYYVTGNVLEDSFNKYVLAESMDVYKDAEIEVRVKQANALVASDISSCDLIYVNNPTENHNKLLYYYDQIMNYNTETNTFSDKVEEGYKGEYYDSITYEDTVAKELAMRLIRNSAGRVVARDLETTMSEYYTKIGVTNTKSIFEILELDNYKEFNHDAYIEAIEKSQKGSISEIADVNLLLAGKNVEISEAAKSSIYELTKDVTYFNDISNKEEFKQLLIKCDLLDNNTGTPLYVEANFENFEYEEGDVKQGYFDKFKSISASGAITMEASIYSAMSTVNANMSNSAMNTIDVATIDESENRIANINSKLTSEVFERLNFDIYNEYNLEQYLQELYNVKGISSTELLELMTQVNDEEKFLARKKIAEAAGVEESVMALTERDFVVADLGIYDNDLIEKYKEELITASSEELIKYSVEDMPIYTDDATSNVIIHFKSDVNWTTEYVKVEYIEEGATEYTVLEEKALTEEIVNGYSRVVLGAMPEGVTLSNIRLTFSNGTTIVEDGSEGNPEDTSELPVATESLEPIEVEVSATGSICGEYWCVYNANSEGKVFTLSDDIITDENYGEEYKYAMKENAIINEEELISIFATVNEKYSLLPGEVTYDFYSWDVAAELFRYATTDENGLIFSTDIVRDIGECKYDSDEIGIMDDLSVQADRTNLVYKSLLAVKLYAAGKFSEDTLAKINEEGLYYADGIETGNGVDEWYISTFTGSTDTKLPLYSLAKRVFTYGNTKIYVRFNGDKFIDYNYDINMKKIFEKSANITNSYADDFKRDWDDIFDKKEEQGDANNAYGYYTLGDIIRYTMNLYINELYCYPLRVLEIQPIGLVSDFGSFSNNDAKYEGAKKIADMLRIDYSEMTSDNYSEYISIKTMSVREFNTQNKDLTAEYDLIYFGANSGNLRRNSSNSRTVYNDTSLNGCVYTSIGDKYTIGKNAQRGSLWIDYKVSNTPNKVSYGNSNYSKTDFYELKSGNTVLAKYSYNEDYAVWSKYFTKAYEGSYDSSKRYTLVNSSPTARAGANDITVKKSKELMEYLKAGYPILFDDKVLYANTYKQSGETSDAQQWTYVDFNSKLYHFVEEAKMLGYDSVAKDYTGKDEDGNDVFADGGKYASLVSITYAKYGSNPDNLSVENKFNGGLSFATKRSFQIDFEYKEGPLEYDEGIEPGDTGNIIPYKKSNGKKNSSYSVYRFVLGVPEGVDMEWIEENYGFQMHVDKSGLGKFTEENTIQLDPVVDFKLDTREIIIEGNWPTADDDSMGGFIPWRLEVYLKSNPNNHYVHTGYSAFEKIDKNGNPKNEVIEVLYIRAQQNLNLDFEKDIVKKTQGDNPVYFLPEYTINCTTIPYNELANGDHWDKTDDGEEYNSSNTKLTVGEFNDSVSESDERYNKEFNMIVFGYCDSYSGMDIDNINTLKNIDYFVSSGHSLIFSHDNSGEILTVNNYVTSGNNVKAVDDGYYYGKYTTSYMRAMLGMDAFGVTYSPKAFVYGYEKLSNGEPDYSKPVTINEADENTYINPDFVEAMYNARLYIDDSSDAQIFRGICEGTVLRQKSGGNLPFADNNGLGNQFGGGLPTTGTVRFVNKGQITMYPYVLGDETVPILGTHFQYQALNLEDEDVQVWATFDSTSSTNYYGVTRGDGANGYYIYTKGNITYSGTGHSRGSSNDMERKLFLNTVVAAIKAGNYGPEIDFTNSDAEQNGESIIYSYDSEDFVTLKFKVTDVDSKTGAEGVFSNIDIFFDKIDDADDENNDDTNPFYQQDSDIILNDPDDDIDIMRDDTGKTKVNYTAENVKNRIEYTIKISYVDIANMWNELHETGVVYTTDEAGNIYKNGEAGSWGTDVENDVKKFFDEYRFAVTATDIPKEINGTNTKGTGITKSAVARVAFRSLFNLN